MLTRLSAAGVRSQIERTADAIKKAGGVDPILVRPPYGAVNATVRANIGDRPCILWDVDTLDWKYRNVDSVHAHAASMRGGSIVLMHDIHPTSVAAVPSVIALARSKGLTPVTVSEMIGPRQAGERIACLKIKKK